MHEDRTDPETKQRARREPRRPLAAPTGEPPPPAEDVVVIHYVHDWRGVTADRDPDVESGAGSDARDPSAAPAFAQARPPRIVYVNDWRRDENDEDE